MILSYKNGEKNIYVEMISDKINLKINFTFTCKSYFFAFLPISFIFGNLITNINTLLLCVLGIFHLKSKILEIKFDRTIKIIFLFFFSNLFFLQV